jgi:hypothetical protein
VVDDAIVVVENIARHVRLGKSRLEAALVGTRELVGPIIAMTITLAAVYAPIGFQGGLKPYFVSRNLAKYRLDNTNKTVILASRQYLAMNGIETVNLLSPHCAFCQRCQQLKRT